MQEKKFESSPIPGEGYKEFFAKMDSEQVESEHTAEVTEIKEKFQSLKAMKRLTDRFYENAFLGMKPKTFVPSRKEVEKRRKKNKMAKQSRKANR